MLNRWGNRNFLWNYIVCAKVHKFIFSVNTELLLWNCGLLIFFPFDYCVLTCCNCLSYLASSRNECIPFYVDYKQVGIVLPDVALLLQEHPEIFTVSSTAIHLNNKYGSCEERTEIMKVFLNGLREAGHLNKALKGWRNEVRLKISGPNRFTSVQLC